jgi:putative two-component system response regulator
MPDAQPTILIVDDEEVIRELLIQKLSNEGYACQEAGNADEALDRLLDSPVDLIILDIRLPGMSGIDLLPKLRVRYPDTAVIMMTSVTDVSSAIKCMKQGAYDYIAKPFDLDEVILSISRTLDRRRLEIENREYQKSLEDKVKEQTIKIRAGFINAIGALVYALEAKDKYTHGHSERVAEISVAIAREMQLTSIEVEQLRLASLIHDIGKIGIKEDILNKAGHLTDSEYDHVQDHSIIGERILSPVVNDETILETVRHHHERYDGTGYPHGLAGEDIPLCARIVAVADTFDAMTSERPYRAALDATYAFSEIRKGRGTQFDPLVVDAFLKASAKSIKV